jgi:tetratricopeptide (TPR) repeat protein
LGDLDGAAQDYAAALRLESRYAGAWFNWAQLQEKRGQRAEALKSYGYAIQVKPEFAEAWLARAELRLEEEQLGGAADDFRKVTKLSGWEPEAWWGLARVAKAQGKRSEAAECLVRYRAAVHRRDRRLDEERAGGIERPAAFEPGLPLAFSQAPLGGP